MSNQVRKVSDIWKFQWTMADGRRQTESLKTTVFIFFIWWGPVDCSATHFLLTSTGVYCCIFNTYNQPAIDTSFLVWVPFKVPHWGSSNFIEFILKLTIFFFMVICINIFVHEMELWVWNVILAFILFCLCLSNGNLRIEHWCCNMWLQK